MGMLVNEQEGGIRKYYIYILFVIMIYWINMYI
jgi:hypothetical protein